MPRPIEALIHTDALAHNLACTRAAAAAGVRVWAVVKANAYGHGIERAYAGLRGADGFALLDLAEAERVRALGWRGPILLLEGAFEPRDLELCSRLNLWHVVHREAQIDWLAMHKTHEPHRVYLKMNSGMNRLGFAPQAFRAAHARLSALPQVDEITLMTHFANADTAAAARASARPARESSAPTTGGPGAARAGGRPVSLEAQRALFEATTRDLPGERSLCNSAAMLRHGADAALAGDWLRPGIALYGSAPDFPEHDIAHWGLRPTMTLRSELIGVQALQPGAAVGYGGAYVAERALRIGVVACGYADGYPRHAPGGNEHGTPVLVQGVRTRTVGRVSMDMIAVDLTPVPAAQPGSEVTLWGEGPRGSRLPIDEVAAAAGTIGYELMCALAPRVPVRVVGA